jgi:uncharacterized protein
MPDFHRLPLFPLHTVLFPGLSLPLRIFEPRYRLMLQKCMQNRTPFGIVLIRSGSEVGNDTVVLSSIGTTARVTKCETTSDAAFLVEVEGETRFVIDETYVDEPYLTARVTPFWEQAAEPLDLQPLYDQTISLFKGYLSGRLADEKKHLSNLQMPRDPVLMSFAVAALLQTSLDERQDLLEVSATSERLRLEIEILRREHGRGDLDLDLDIDTFAGVTQTFVPIDSADVVQQLSRN